MPSSTFSSSDRAPDGPWCLTWIIAILLAASILGGLEYFWRSHGVRPLLVDDAALWAYHRGRVYERGARTVVLVGASRMVGGFSTRTFRERFPDYGVVQLGVVGRRPIATLRDLAEDQRFDGIVICSLTAENVWRYARDDQQEYVDYYHRHAAFNARIDLRLRFLAQSNLVAVNPSVRLKTLWRGWLANKPIVRRTYADANFDRSRLFNFADPNTLEEKRNLRIREVQGATGRPDPGVWFEHARDVVAMIDKIQSHGGTVVLLRFPTTGRLHEILAERFPREEFWDRLAASTTAVTIHFQDVPGLSDFDCPDYSHLDYRDAPAFTNALADELVRRGVLRE